MKARGKREAKRSASPLEESDNHISPERAASVAYFGPSGLNLDYDSTRGDALHFASRLPLAFIFRAFGARLLTFEQSPTAQD